MKKKILKLAIFIFLSVILGTMLQNTAINPQPAYAENEFQVSDIGGSTDSSATQEINGEAAVQTALGNLSYQEVSGLAEEKQRETNRLQDRAEELDNRAAELEQEAARAYTDEARNAATQARAEADQAQKAANEAKKVSDQMNTIAETAKIREEQAANIENWSDEPTLKPTLIPKPDLLPGPSTDAQKNASSGAKSILVDTILPNLTLGMIGFCGLWALVFLIIGSVRFMTSYGNEEAAKKAKDQIVYSIVGFMIALLAYAIVTIIINLKIEGNTSRPTSFIETAYADPLIKSCTDSSKCGNSQVCLDGICVNQIDVLMSRPGEAGTGIGDKYIDTKAVANLPSVSIENIFTTVIKSILGWSMILTIMAIVVAAVFYLTSSGKEENTSKAKNILINLLIGLAIMAAAYGIITGIAQFNFFTAAPQ